MHSISPRNGEPNPRNESGPRAVEDWHAKVSREATDREHWSETPSFRIERADAQSLAPTAATNFAGPA